MIYEHLRGSQSRWKQYLDVLPETFNTLMFWSEAELAELQGSAVRHKVGKTDADQTFRDQLVPIIQVRSTLHTKVWSMLTYHVLRHIQTFSLPPLLRHLLVHKSVFSSRPVWI